MSIKVCVHSYVLGNFSRLEGRLLTLLETLGLPSGQEKAIKDLVRNEIWSMWDYQASFIETKEVENPTAILEAHALKED